MIKVFKIFILFICCISQGQEQNITYLKIDQEESFYDIVRSKDSEELYNHISYRTIYIINKKNNVSNLEDEIKSIADSKEFNLIFVNNRFKNINEKQLKIDFVTEISKLLDVAHINKPNFDISIESIFKYYYLQAQKIDSVSLKDNSFYYRNYALKVFNEFHKNFNRHSPPILIGKSEKKKLKLINLKKYYKCKSSKKFKTLFDRLKKSDRIFILFKNKDKNYEMIEVSLLLKGKFI